MIILLRDEWKFCVNEILVVIQLHRKADKNITKSSAKFFLALLRLALYKQKLLKGIKFNLPRRVVNNRLSFSFSAQAESRYLEDLFM